MSEPDLYTQVDHYMAASVLPSNPVLDRVLANSHAAGLVPHAVSPLQANLLGLLIQMSGAKRVLEIGCLGGYSAIAMAQLLPSDGHIITTEIDTRTARVAQENIDQSGYADRIELRVGPALPLLDTLISAEQIFDFVFIDADKINHRNYVERALRMAKPGTVIVADNVVRGGAVLDASSQENSVIGVRDLFDYAMSLSGVTMTAQQTVGEKGHDGMMILRVDS